MLLMVPPPPNDDYCSRTRGNNELNPSFDMVRTLYGAGALDGVEDAMREGEDPERIISGRCKRGEKLHELRKQLKTPALTGPPQSLWSSVTMDLSSIPHNDLRPNQPSLSSSSVDNAGNATASAKQYSKHPNFAGSLEDNHDALSVLEFIQAELVITPPPHLTKNLLWTLMETRFGALISQRMEMPAMKMQPNPEIILLHGHHWSANVEGQGKLVYVNIGTHEDYNEILPSGQNLTGKVVITCYGGIFRGLKLNTVSSRLLPLSINTLKNLVPLPFLFNCDPRDDGLVTVQNGFTTYPNGLRVILVCSSNVITQWTSSRIPGIQRHQESLLMIKPRAKKPEGTIGEESSAGKPVKGTSELTTMRLRPKPVILIIPWVITPIWNTMAAIPGHVRNEVVIVGCHRDAEAVQSLGRGCCRPSVWCYRAAQNCSRAWKLTSKWLETSPNQLGGTRRNMASLIPLNMVKTSQNDRIGVLSGYPWAFLIHFIKTTALDVAHPSGEEVKTLWDAKNDGGPFKLFGTVASSDQSILGTPCDAPHHFRLIYDSKRWQEVYTDPGFKKHVAIAQRAQHSMGLFVLRLMDLIMFPMNTIQYAPELDGYLDRGWGPTGCVDSHSLSKVHSLGKAEDFLHLMVKKQFSEIEIEVDRVTFNSVAKEPIINVRRTNRQWARVGSGHGKHTLEKYTREAAVTCKKLLDVLSAVVVDSAEPMPPKHLAKTLRWLACPTIETPQPVAKHENLWKAFEPRSSVDGDSCSILLVLYDVCWILADFEPSFVQKLVGSEPFILRHARSR
ncbi:hypothetical protein EV360DRAFT_69086 [Lentinula raphanica]|nr:hypothetical protein EV360DRAFT_69086 [Lentinula raphanica]